MHHFINAHKSQKEFFDYVHLIVYIGNSWKTVSFGKFRFCDPCPCLSPTDVRGKPRNYSARRIGRTVVEGARSLSSYDERVTAPKSYRIVVMRH